MAYIFSVRNSFSDLLEWKHYRIFSRRCFKEVWTQEKLGNFENFKHPSFLLFSSLYLYFLQIEQILLRKQTNWNFLAPVSSLYSPASQPTSSESDAVSDRRPWKRKGISLRRSRPRDWHGGQPVNLCSSALSFLSLFCFFHDTSSAPPRSVSHRLVNLICIWKNVFHCVCVCAGGIN